MKILSILKGGTKKHDRLMTNWWPVLKEWVTFVITILVPPLRMNAKIRAEQITDFSLLEVLKN